jgi:hypothetical protein
MNKLAFTLATLAIGGILSAAPQANSSQKPAGPKKEHPKPKKEKPAPKKP